MPKSGSGYERTLDPSPKHHLSSSPTSTSFSKTSAQEHFSENRENFLPPKQFLKAQKPIWKRALWQTCVGISFLGLFLVGPLFTLGYLNPKFNSDIDSSSFDYFSCSNYDHSLFDPVPNLTFGNFTFGEVKLIDAASNLLVGRGVQGLLGFISYEATSNILMRTMEATPVELELFSGLTFNPSSIFTFIPLAKAVFKLRGVRFKFVVAWLLFSTAVLLAIPTLIDTTTGYIQTQDTEVMFRNGTRIPSSSFNLTAYNAAEVNHTDSGYGTVCTPSEHNGYQWGFSGIWLVIYWSVLGIWLLGTYTVWMDAQHHSELVRKGRSMNALRAASDLSDAMAEIVGPNTAAYSGKELKKALRGNLTIMYQTTINEKTRSGTLGLTSNGTGKMPKMSWSTWYGKSQV